MLGLGVYYALLVIVQLHISQASIPVCLQNCVQCKQMFGKYFHGKVCGDACISTNGGVIPDCNNPGTLGNYLKRFY